jgi:hypothetical protein
MTTAEIQRYIEKAIAWIDKHGDSSADACNIRELLHCHQGCEECRTKWRPEDTDYENATQRTRLQGRTPS